LCGKAASDLIGGSFEIKTMGHYLPVINDKYLYELVKGVADRENVKFIVTDTKLTGEDYGYFCEKYPSLMYWLGTHKSKAQRESLHSKNYCPDNDSIEIGIKIMYGLIAKICG